MSWVAASGWDRNETWEAATSTIVAFARSAMNRCSAGGIALSWVPSRYQHGSVVHAGGPDGAAANAAAASHYPYGLLTMIVSLEAIFLSTFVMISQNRADAKRQLLADEQWKTVQEEDQQNEELLDLSRQILALTKEVHARPPA